MKSMDTKSKIVLLILTMAFFSTVWAKGSDFYYTQGIIAFNAGDYVKAEKYLKTALILNPSLENNSDIKYMIGLSAWYAGDLVTARAYLPQEHLSMIASSTKLPKRNLVAEIAKWESLSSPIINVEDKGKKKKVPKSMEFLIFFGIFSAIMGGFFAYKFSKRVKPHRATQETMEEEMEDIDMPFTGAVKSSEEPLEMPADGPAEDEIKMKLQNLLNMDFHVSDEENVSVVEEPEKIVEKIGTDATEEEIREVEGAVQELVSKES